MTMAIILEGINYLARKAKIGPLTAQEELLRQELRQAYLALIRQSFRSQIETVKVIDETGADITPQKLREVQIQKGYHQRELDLPEKMAQFLAMIPEQ